LICMRGAEMKTGYSLARDVLLSCTEISTLLVPEL
jgi:hypothetical protein